MCPLTEIRTALTALFRRGLLLILPFMLAAASVRAAGPLPPVCINELLRSNSSSVPDHEGEYQDWIELYNAGDEPVDLTGFGLSDNDDPFKWTFPAASLQPNEHLLVYASDRDHRLWYNWATLIDWGATWRYRANTTAPPAAWREPA